MFEDTRSNNTLDSIIYSNNVKLSEDKVKLIRQDMRNYDFNVKNTKSIFDSKWASYFGVHKESIGSVRRGDTWKHVS